VVKPHQSGATWDSYRDAALPESRGPWLNPVTAGSDGVARSFASIAVVEVLGAGTQDGHVDIRGRNTASER
jgi:hypothetical protein